MRIEEPPSTGVPALRPVPATLSRVVRAPFVAIFALMCVAGLLGVLAAAAMRAWRFALIALAEALCFGGLALGVRRLPERHPAATLRQRARRALGRLRRRRGARRVLLRDVARQPAGAFVRVRGRVRVREAVPAVLGGPGGACSLAYVTRGRDAHFISEQVADFDLADGDGTVLRVLAEGAELAATPRLSRRRGFDVRRGGEVLVEDGDVVEVVGTVDSVVDPTIAERLERDTPLRAALRSAPGRPLQIIP